MLDATPQPNRQAAASPALVARDRLLSLSAERARALATGLEPAPHAPEAGEVFEIHWLPFEQAVARVYSGEFTDGKTCLGLLKAAKRLSDRRT